MDDPSTRERESETTIRETEKDIDKRERESYREGNRKKINITTI